MGMLDAVRAVKTGPVFASIKIKRKILTLDEAHKYKAGHMGRSHIFLLFHKARVLLVFNSCLFNFSGT